MKLWSPYQNLDPKAEYPRVFFWTNTRDDRVHPAHARKMVARMTDMGKPVLYYENTEGGHASGANLNQRAYTAGADLRVPLDDAAVEVPSPPRPASTPRPVFGLATAWDPGGSGADSGATAGSTTAPAPR